MDRSRLGRAPSFRRPARCVVAYLYDPRGLSLDPELLLDLFDDTAAPGAQLARVRDTLDVQLHERREEAETGIKAPDLARTLGLAVPQQPRSVILDCCFSGAAARAFIGHGWRIESACGGDGGEGPRR